MLEIKNIELYNEIMNELIENQITIKEFISYTLKNEYVDNLIKEYSNDIDNYTEYYLQYEIIQEHGDIFKLSENLIKNTIDLENEIIENEIIYENEYELTYYELKQKNILL